VYIYEMEVHQVPGTTMMETFGLAVVPEIRVRVHEIHGQVTSWGRFEKWLRNEYFDEDTKRVTKKDLSLTGWNNNLKNSWAQMGDCTKDLYYFLSHIECRSVLEV
jgi:hypothetical protein